MNMYGTILHRVKYALGSVLGPLRMRASQKNSRAANPNPSIQRSSRPLANKHPARIAALQFRACWPTTRSITSTLRAPGHRLFASNEWKIEYGG